MNEGGEYCAVGRQGRGRVRIRAGFVNWLQ